MTTPTYTVEVYRAFPKVKNKDGDMVTKPVTIRRLTITGDMALTDEYRINLTYRKGVGYYTLHKKVTEKLPWWDKSGKVPESHYVKEGLGVGKDEMVTWLGKLFRNYDTARKAVLELTTTSA